MAATSRRIGANPGQLARIGAIRLKLVIPIGANPGQSAPIWEVSKNSDRRSSNLPEIRSKFARIRANPFSVCFFPIGANPGEIRPDLPPPLVTASGPM